MKKDNAIRLFQDKKVRVHWDDVQEKWFFSVVDVVGVLADNSRARKYWSNLKKNLKEEGSNHITDVKNYKFLCDNCEKPSKNIIQGEKMLIHKVEFNN